MYLTKNRNLLLIMGAAAIALCGISSTDAAPLAIVNAGFETDTAPVVGATGWTITSGGTDWFTTTAGAPDSSVDPEAAAEGINWLSGNRLAGSAGSSSNPQTLVQLVDISADSALVDSGAAQLVLDFMFADNDSYDTATVNVSFFSDVAGTTAIGTALTTGDMAPTGPEAGSTDRAPWEARDLSGAVPALARSLEIEIVNVRSNGSAGNVHFDAMSGAIVPEPTSFALCGIGLLAMALGRKRS